MIAPRQTSPWWMDRLAGKPVPIDMNRPAPGFYRRRLVRGGPWVPVRIWFGPPFDPITREPLDRSWCLRCEVAGRQEDPADHWLHCAEHPVAEAEYRYMAGLAAWAGEHAPAAPEANPRRRVDLAAMPSLF